jgi:two-component system NarL family response regulator
VKVLVVDDHDLFREGLVSLLSKDKFFEVVGQAGSVHEAIESAKKLQPDLILMDFSLPDGDGAEATTAILPELPECKIVFLTMHDGDENLFAAIRSGAKGYLLKNVPVAKLVSSLKSIEKGEAAISGTMTMRLLEEFSQSHKGVSSEVCNAQSVLSRREIEILREIASGESNGEIAVKLFLSVNTVKHHIHNILVKLKLKNRRAAILYAQSAGLIR